jgi:hypothetical protein
MRFLGKVGAEVLLKQAVLTLFLYLLRPYFLVRFSVLLILLFYAARRLVRTKSVLTEIR